MIMKNGKQVNFIYKNGKKIDKIIRHGKVYFEQGFTREKTSTTLPITFSGVGKDLKDYRVYGNTYQNSISGKNLLDISKIDKTTENGVTCSYDPETQIVTLNGTCTKNNTPFSVTGANLQITQFKTKLYLYYVSGSIENKSTFRLYDKDWSKNLLLSPTELNAEHQVINKVAPTTFTAVNCGIRLENGTVCNNFQFKVMVADSNDDTYEPYTGGQPSPNPDYPQEIISCGDLITDSQDENYGKYKIPVNVNNSITNIYLDEPLRKIDGYSDYIDFINGKIIRKIKETLLDNNIAWTTDRFAKEKRIYTSSSNIDSNMRAVNSNSQVGYLLSNQYKAEKLENILALNVRYGIGISSTSYFSILNQDYASTTEFLQALYDNPIVLDYALITPTEESITLPSILTVDGNNTLNIETEITPSQIYIKYKSNN